MSTSTATLSRPIELPSLVPKPGTLARVNNTTTTTPVSDSPADPNSIIEASRLADSTAPDGGYGWVVVASCSLICFWFVGTSYSWGVIQAALVAEHVSSPSTLAFVGSLAVACVAVFAVLNSRLVRSIGSRGTAMLGVTLMGLGQICAGFSVRNVGGLFVTAGLMMGYGMSCCFMACSVTPAQWFSKRRGLANGIVYGGGGIGGAVISLAMSAIVSRLGIAWTFRLIGLVMLATGLPAAWFIKERGAVRTAPFIDTRLFRDSQFITLFLVGVIATFPLFVPPFFLPLYARSLGLSAPTGAALVSAFNFSSAVGRILCGLMGDKLGPVNTLFISLLLSSISMLTIWPVSTSLAPLAIFTIINGAGNGGFFSIMPTVVGNVFGSARVSVAMGMIVTGWTGGYLMGAPIAGYLLDAYGGEKSGFQSYRPAILWAGSMALASAGLVGFVRLRMSKSPMKRL